MLDDQEGFVRLPNERLIYSSPPRTSVSLTPPSGYKGAEKLSIQSSTGCIHLTNQRVVYLPASRSNDFQSFSSPLLNIRDSHVSAPFFGPNVWTALAQPVSGGGISPSLPAVQLKVTFKEGGAFDFHTNFERIRERLEQAVENTSHGTRGHQNVDLSAVHLEELPAYEAPPDASQHARPSQTPEESQSSRASDTGTEPVEPPPCYEEVQSQSSERSSSWAKPTTSLITTPFRFSTHTRPPVIIQLISVAMGLSEFFSDVVSSFGFTEAQAEAPAPDTETETTTQEEPAEEEPASTESAETESAEPESAEETPAEEESAEETPEEEEAEAEEEEEEEEEEEPEDIKPKLEEECAHSAVCAPYKHHYDECVERVTRQEEDEDFKGPKEDCVEEFFHLTHCVTACAAPKLWRELK
ncbi:unnamed protein product [Penicillium egyptiacum]|uniref:Cytochrome b-c1 complex subunit 6, mitochondrial n=1 Tax=Penicillium egyptiacum TaxID=1303716 RepID=A0A9W4KGX8_9EURO|nr:unnamed protein product [Penicillium egyptiacum]